MFEDVWDEMPFHKYVELKREDARIVGYARKLNIAKDLKDKLTSAQVQGGHSSWKTISTSISNQIRSVLSLPACTCRTMPTRGGVT